MSYAAAIADLETRRAAENERARLRFLTFVLESIDHDGFPRASSYTVENLTARGLIRAQGDRYALTAEGRLLLHANPAEVDSQLDALRRIVENLSDDAIRAFVDTIIRAILHGLADELADRMVDALVTQLAVSGGPGQGGGNDQGEGAEPPSGTVAAAPPGGQDTTEPATPKTKRKRSPAQDAVSHTCEICGRTGTRRFTKTGTGWRCSPTATKCPGNRAEKPAENMPENMTVQPDPAPGQGESEDCNKFGEISTPNVALPDRSSTPTEPAKAAPPAYTARCQDCTRTWTLTGRVLRMAVDTHELKHAHIVNVIGGAE